MAAERPHPSYEEYLSRYERSGRRRSGRKRRPVNLLGLIAVLCVAVILLQGRVFILKEIEINGNQLRSNGEIAGLSGLSLGMNIFRVNTAEAARNIASDPYLEVLGAQVCLPDTVKIEIRERSAEAAVNCAGVIMLVDEEGFILERLTSLPQQKDVIVVSGLDIRLSAQGNKIESGKSGQLKSMNKILLAIDESGTKELVSELNVTDPDNLYLVSETGVQVLLGDDEQLDVKLLWMRAVLEELTKDGIMHGVLDVSSGKNAVYADR